MTDLDPVIHAPLRLRLCSMLSAVDAIEFATLREPLVEAGYVTSRKETVSGRRTTWISLTRRGRTALRHHLAALQTLIDDARIESP